MKVIILGSGVIGVSSAYYLAKAGHEVTVIDRQPGPALETSFANAGEVSPGYSAPWAGPELPIKAMKWLFMRHRPLVVRPSLDPAMIAWSIRLLANCTTRRYEYNKAKMVRLAEYSRACLESLRQLTGIQYDQRCQGTLQMFRTQEQVDHAAADIAVLKKEGVSYQVLDRAGCLQYEPGLTAVANKIAGGLRLPGDETGDCFKFTNALAKTAEGAGVHFRWQTGIRGIEHDRRAITGIALEGGEVVTADAYVLALGSFSPKLARQLDIDLPIYPVKGYSLTFAVDDDALAPQSTIMDETYKVAITRLGDRVRVGGTAELNGFNTSLRASRRATLEHVVGDLFPKAGDYRSASFWTGLRPMTPDGPPYLGTSPLDNLYFNTGHGTLGWTMAAGSASALADLVSGKTPDIDLNGFGLER